MRIRLVGFSLKRVWRVWQVLAEVQANQGSATAAELCYRQCLQAGMNNKWESFWNNYLINSCLGQLWTPHFFLSRFTSLTPCLLTRNAKKTWVKCKKKKKKTIKSPVVMNLQCSFSQTVAVRNLSRCLCSRNVELLISLYLVNSKLNSVLWCF